MFWCVVDCGMCVASPNRGVCPDGLLGCIAGQGVPRVYLSSKRASCSRAIGRDAAAAIPSATITAGTPWLVIGSTRASLATSVSPWNARGVSHKYTNTRILGRVYRAHGRIPRLPASLLTASRFAHSPRLSSSFTLVKTYFAYSSSRTRILAGSQQKPPTTLVFFSLARFCGPIFGEPFTPRSRKGACSGETLLSPLRSATGRLFLLRSLSTSSTRTPFLLLLLINP